MKPLRIRIDRIIDYGTIVSLVGHDIVATKPVTIHVENSDSFGVIRPEAMREKLDLGDAVGSFSSIPIQLCMDRKRQQTKTGESAR